MGAILVSLIFIGLGLLYLLKPNIGHRVLYPRTLLSKGLEPSKFSLICVRIVGGCCVLIGSFILFLAIYS